MSTNYSPSHAQGFTSEGSVVQDKLFDRETITRKVTIKSGAGALARGALLGEVTADKKYLLSLAAATDGSETPDAILLHAVDATASDQEAIVAIKGRFASAGVIFGAGHTAASVDRALRDRNIYLETIIGA